MSSIKMILALSLIAVVVFVGVKIIPPYFENYQFQDAIKNEATLDTYSSKTETDIRMEVFRKAQDFDIPITEEQIHVQRTGLQGRGMIIIRAPYVVHVDLPGYPMDLHFDVSTENRGVL